MKYINNFLEKLNNRKISLIKDTLSDVIEDLILNNEIKHFYELEYMIRTLSKLTKYSKEYILETFLIISAKYNCKNKIMDKCLMLEHIDMNFIYSESIYELSSIYSAEIISIFLNCNINYVKSILKSYKA